MMMIINQVIRPLLFSSSHRHVTLPLHARAKYVRTITKAGLAAYEASSSEREEEYNLNDANKKSRNQKKREARKAVKWGMDLASFTLPQIKTIVRVASLEPEVFEALMLVKRLGRDVREGKRRQYSYIGRLLREAEPELMDGLIEATKDSDQGKFQAVCNKFQALSGSAESLIGEEDDDDESEESDSSDEDEDSDGSIERASRWFDGLVNKDVDISKEVYSLQDVDFDRQELRRLVRQLQTTQERQIDSEENAEGVDKAIIRAEKSLSRFLQNLVKQLPSEFQRALVKHCERKKDRSLTLELVRK